MGTMLQAADLTLDDFEGHEGCNEILNVTRPDVVRGGPRRLLRGRRATASRPTPSAPTSPTSASTASPTGSTSCPRPAPGSPARSPTAASTPDRPRWVLGSIGPGHQAAHPRPRRRTPTLRDAYQQQRRRPARRRRRRAARRDLPGPAAGQGRGHRRPAGAWPRPGCDVPLIAQVTVETTGTMLLGSRDRRRADRAGAARHRPDRPQLRHRPGRDERAPALPVPARRGSRCPACPTPACPSSTADGAHYPLTPDELADAHDTVRPRVRPVAGRRLLRHHARAPRARSSSAVARPRRRAARKPRPEPGVASLYQHVPFRQDTVVPVDRRAHQRQRLQGVPRGDAGGPLGRLRGDRPRPDPRRRAPARPVRRLRRPRRRRRHARARRPVRHRLHAADRARLHRAAGASRPGWRCSAAARSSTRSTTRTATAPTRRFARIMPLVTRARRRRGRADHRRGGPGPHRRAGRSRVAEPADRRPDRQLGHARSRTSSSTA